MSWQKCRDASDLTRLNQPETWDEVGPLARRRLATAKQSQEEEEEEEDLIIPSGWVGVGSMRKVKRKGWDCGEGGCGCVGWWWQGVGRAWGTLARLGVQAAQSSASSQPQC